MIGTFYRSANPESPMFVEVGDSVSEGKVVCIIEAMKLFNEIESEVSGRIVRVLVENATPVEYDQPLFLVEPIYGQKRKSERVNDAVILPANIHSFAHSLFTL